MPKPNVRARPARRAEEIRDYVDEVNDIYRRMQEAYTVGIIRALLDVHVREAEWKRQYFINAQELLDFAADHPANVKATTDYDEDDDAADLDSCDCRCKKSRRLDTDDE